MSDARSGFSQPCPFCHTPVPAGATYCTGCHARYGYENPNVQRSFRGWLLWLIISLVIVAVGFGLERSDGMYGGGESLRIVFLTAGGLGAAFGVLGTVLAGMSLGLALMRGKMWWR
jgi:hypothetical protein